MLVLLWFRRARSPMAARVRGHRHRLLPDHPQLRHTVRSKATAGMSIRPRTGIPQVVGKKNSSMGHLGDNHIKSCRNSVTVLPDSEGSR